MQVDISGLNRSTVEPIMLATRNIRLYPQQFNCEQSMRNYEKTIKSVSEVKTMASHMTSLGKIMTVSEDGHLCYLIANVVQALQYQHQNSVAKSTPTSLRFFPIPQTMQLVDYCNFHIQMKKPEWQVLAEKNGWTPPQLSF